MASRPRCRSRRVLPLWFALLLAPHTLTHARPDPTEVQANETPTHEQITVVHCDTTKGRVEMEVRAAACGAAEFVWCQRWLVTQGATRHERSCHKPARSSASAAQIDGLPA